jgi:menaquinone-9 beta-reductase
MNAYDVVIIGAGPAGSSAAFFLTRAGLKVLLLDKADFPRDKTCGDGLTPRALPILSEMGLLGQITGQGWRLDELAITAPSGQSVALSIPDLPYAPSYAAVLPRLTLDNLIRERALQSGVTFLGQTHVRHIERDESGVIVYAEKEHTFRAQIAIIATGVSTRLLSTIGLLTSPQQMIVAARSYFEGIPDLPNQFQFRFDGVPLPGYGWIFPLSQSSANVGAGFLPAARHGNAHLSAQSGYDRFTGHPALKNLLRDAHQNAPLKSFPIRTDFATAPTFTNRILLAGEAAGLVNPLTGDGIDYALESGKIAAEHLIAMFQSGDFSLPQFAAYDALLRQRYQNLFRFCGHLQRLCLNATTLNILVPLAAQHPKLAVSLVNLVLGGKPLPERLSPLTLIRGVIDNL